ncbi:DUF7835 family putative zinc beta-ribbon protein [Halomarina litorea]|uniref:DUF7835 family putative zinc beta-ribbon protein n=1 Tax=Halomarina litorea TaxID=2961595 RepID=UPI003F5F247C
MPSQSNKRSIRITEECSACERSTSHLVSLAFVKEGSRRPGFSKKPVRITECTSCGRTERDFQTRGRPTEIVKNGKKPEG